MKFERFDPGLMVSAIVHAALLLFALVSFADAKKFDDAQESTSVDVVTDKQFNEIMKGAKNAKPSPKPSPADAAKETTELPGAQKAIGAIENKPETKTPEARTDAPAAPPPELKHLPDPGQDEAKDPPLPPVKAVEALPPPPPPVPEPRPEPAKPKAPPPPPQAEAKPPPEPDKPEAEVVAPKPPPRPPTNKTVDAPEPPKKQRPATDPTPPPKVAEKPPEAPEPPKAPPRPPEPAKPTLKTDEVARFLAKQAPDPAKPAARPKAAEPDDTHAPLDPNAIRALLNKDKPQQKPATAPDRLTVASLGAPNGGAARMSPSLLGQLNSLMTEHFNQCWNKTGLDLKKPYVAQIIVQFRVDGSFAIPPVLRNPSSDPKSSAIADSAMRAVRSCGPVPIPAALQPFYLEWKDGLLRMDPSEP